MSKSLLLAKSFLNKTVEVTIDRPLGTVHPKWGYQYSVNYGYLKGVLAPDGEELDAYILGVTTAMTSFTGRCVALIHRLKDDDDKLIVTPEDVSLTDEEIELQVHFQEQWFAHEILRG